MRERIMVVVFAVALSAPGVAIAQQRGEETRAGAAELEAPEPGAETGPDEEAFEEVGEETEQAEAVEVPARPMPRQAFSVHLLGLLSGGIALQYERFPESLRDWSFAVSLGGRLPAGGDYASLTLGVGGEVRWWAFNFTEGPWDERADGGFFLGGRLDLGWSHVWDTVNGGAVGDTVVLTPSVLVGWRFDVARVVEITPTVGIGVRNEIDPSGRLAAYSRGTATFALTVGWMR